MRVLICGGRTFCDYLFFVRKMREIEAKRGTLTTVIHGGARGTDWLAHLWANSPVGNREEISFPADWKSLGKKAGPLRNQRMIDEGKPDIVVAFPGQKGTSDLVRRARKAKIEIIEVTTDSAVGAPMVG